MMAIKKLLGGIGCMAVSKLKILEFNKGKSKLHGGNSASAHSSKCFSKEER